MVSALLPSQHPIVGNYGGRDQQADDDLGVDPPVLE